MNSLITQVKGNFETFKFILANFYYALIRNPSVINFLRIKYKRNLRRIEIDLTYACQLKCFNCNRSCRQAPDEARMTEEQIKEFIKESIENDIKWERIRILGGEPTLHPDLLKILSLIREYKHMYSRSTRIQLITNGSGQGTGAVLSKVPADIEIVNSFKKSPRQLFSPFNLAPLDRAGYKEGDYSKGCVNYSKCGIGLNAYGYYCCGNAAGIDRVFGFDISRKHIPLNNDPMEEQLKVFCRLCGIFVSFKLTTKERISPSWKKAYEKYAQAKPRLTYY